MAIDGLPHSKRGISRLAAEQGWLSEAGPNRRCLFDVNALPPEIQAQIQSKMILRMGGATAKDTNAPSTLTDNKARQGGAGRPSGTSFFDKHTSHASAILSYISGYRHSAPNVMDLLRAEGLVPLPPLRTLQRYMAQIEYARAAELQWQRNPDAAKSSQRLALGRADGGTTYAHQYWELDTTKADVMTANGRRMILGVIDRFSRRARFIVGDSESAMSVRHLLQRAIKDWGVLPHTIVVDNGSGYVNATIKSACEMLGIEHKPCAPGSPEQKPFVERLFGTFTRQRAVLLPGFTGHNVAQAQQLRARARKETGRAEIFAQITAEELQVILDNWTIGVYEQRVHGGIGIAPLAKAMRSPIAARMAPDAETVRRALSAFVANSTITKRGLRWKKARYWCPELAAYMNKTVHVRRDEDDLGALLVFDEDHNFIGTAVNYERAGTSEKAFALAARQNQKSHEKQINAFMRDVKRQFPIERASEALRRQDALEAGKLAVLPARALPAALPPANPETQQQQRTASVIPLTAAINPALQSADKLAARVARCETLIARAKAGHEVPAEDLALANAFVAGAAYKAFKAEEAYAAGLPAPYQITNRRKP